LRQRRNAERGLLGDLPVLGDLPGSGGVL